MVSTGSLQFIHRLVFLGIYYWPKIVQKKIEPRKHSAISIFHLMKLFFFSRFGRCWGNRYQEYEYKETTSRTNKYTNAKWNQKVQRNEVGFDEFARNLKLNKKKNTRINLERNYKLNYEKSVENYAADNVSKFDDIHNSINICLHIQLCKWRKSCTSLIYQGTRDLTTAETAQLLAKNKESYEILFDYQNWSSMKNNTEDASLER